MFHRFYAAWMLYYCVVFLCLLIECFSMFYFLLLRLIFSFSPLIFFCIYLFCYWGANFCRFIWGRRPHSYCQHEGHLAHTIRLDWEVKTWELGREDQVILSQKINRQSNGVTGSSIIAMANSQGFLHPHASELTRSKGQSPLSSSHYS